MSGTAIHGHSRPGKRSRTYVCWRNMKERCLNPKNDSFCDYGGRGITICQTWKLSFIQFLLDMGECPEDMTIERIDVNGNYEKGNCCWIDRAAQARNKRDNRRILYNGKLVLQTELSEQLFGNRHLISQRIGRGWSEQKAVSALQMVGENHPNSTKTHCKNGHEFTPENTYIYSENKRCCKTCKANRCRKYRAAA